MTSTEFSNEFDVLYNSITSNQAPGLDEYEKSVFLTKAQDEIVKSYFNPRLNKSQEGFDGNEQRQIDFSMITKVADCTKDTTSIVKLDPRANTVVYTLAPDIMMILNESVKVTRDKKVGNNGEIIDEGKEVYLTVIPLDYREYSRLMSKPYKRPAHYQAWRLLQSNSSYKAEIIIGPNDEIKSYTIRYIRRPKAIRLANFDDVTLGGEKTIQDCELDPMLHHEILQRAVELAKAAYTGDLQSQIALGQASQTNIGAVQSNR